MITSLLVISLLISIIFNAFIVILAKNQIAKIQIYENWILDFKKDVEMTLENLRGIDKKGTFATSLNDKGLFESDDEVGVIFKEMEAIVEKLNQRTQ